MKEEVFEDILRHIELPLGELLSDNTTYRVTSKEFAKIKTKHFKELEGFDKFLVLSSNGNTVVGGILFYGAVDIQVITFPEYRGMHYMSQVHKNGILKSECYPKQKVTLDTHTIDSFNDFRKKYYLVSSAGLNISNLPEIHKYFSMFTPCKRYKGFQETSLDEFIKKYS